MKKMCPTKGGLRSIAAGKVKPRLALYYDALPIFVADGAMIAVLRG